MRYEGGVRMVKKLFTLKNGIALLLASLFVGVIGMLWKSDVILLVETVTILILALYMSYKLRLKRALVGFAGLAAFIYIGAGMNGLLAMSAFGAIAMFISNVSLHREGVQK